jgi:hydrogenase 3 maturation protease
MCIGKRNSGDDAIGPYIADKLEIPVINCETVPENYLSIVKRYNPKNLIIIDAVDMDLPPGEIRIIPEKKIGVMHISTHGIPLSLLIKYLKKFIPNVTLIGIQPKSLTGPLSTQVKKSGDFLIKILKKGDLGQIKRIKD